MMPSVHGVPRGNFASRADNDVEEIQRLGRGQKAEPIKSIHPVWKKKVALSCSPRLPSAAEKRALGVARSFAVLHFPGTMLYAAGCRCSSVP
jgi:hypothetical protein